MEEALVYAEVDTTKGFIFPGDDEMHWFAKIRPDGAITGYVPLTPGDIKDLLEGDLGYELDNYIDPVISIILKEDAIMSRDWMFRWRELLTHPKVYYDEELRKQILRKGVKG